MARRKGVVVHSERGYKVYEVIEQMDLGDTIVVGYMLEGPGVDERVVYSTEAEAVAAIPRPHDPFDPPMGFRKPGP